MPPRSVTCIVRFRRSLSEAGNRRCRPGALCCLSVVLSTPAVLGRLRSVTVSLFADGFKVGILTPDQASRAPVRATRSRAPHAASTSLNPVFRPPAPQTLRWARYGPSPAVRLIPCAFLGNPRGISCAHGIALFILFGTQPTTTDDTGGTT